jgi:uncharacterized membrane protein YphA (DoxX/SURF4 family)
MIKTILVILLGVFFLVNGINHFYNTDVLKKYASKRGLFSPKLMVQLSGILLLLGGLSLVSGFFTLYGIIGLCVFLITATFTIHTFWTEKERNSRLNESLHFTKNLVILVELIYIGMG